MATDPLPRLRKICLGFPEAHEKEAWGAPTFRVKDRLFAMFAENHHGDGRIAVWCKAPPGAQEMLVAGDPRRFFVPPYVGPSGWVGVRLDLDDDWRQVTRLLADGWRLAAPKRLLAALEGPTKASGAAAPPARPRPAGSSASSRPARPNGKHRRKGS